MDWRQRRVADFINLLRPSSLPVFAESNQSDGSNHLKVMGVFELHSPHSKHARTHTLTSAFSLF